MARISPQGVRDLNVVIEVLHENGAVNSPSMGERYNLGGRVALATGVRQGFQQGNITVHPIPPLSKDEARIFKMLQEGDLPHQRGEEASKKLSEGYKKPWNKCKRVS